MSKALLPGTVFSKEKKIIASETGDPFLEIQM